MPRPKVWKNDTNGKFYHEECFLENESKEGFTEVKLDALTMDDECSSCDGIFLAGLEPEDVSDESLESDEEEE